MLQNIESCAIIQKNKAFFTDIRKFLSRYRAAVKILIPLFCDGFTVKIGLSVRTESPFFVESIRRLKMRRIFVEEGK